LKDNIDILQKSIDYLEEEHELINIVCDKIEEKCINILNNELDINFFRNAIIFIRNYADGEHHKKEEDILFKEMIENLGPVADKVVRNGMLVEHQMARGYVMELENNLNIFEKNKDKKAKLQILTNAMSYVNLLRNHIIKENTTVYPFGVRELSEDSKLVVAKEMDEYIKREKEKAEDKEKLLKDLGIK